jgi:MATE efflux family protein
MNNQMRFQGNARFALWGILSGAIVNVLLDPLFIFTFQWGIMGAAMATLVGQLISFFILLWMSYKGGNLGFSIKKSKPSISYLKEIVAGGTPSLSRQGLACLAMMLLNKGAGVYGDVAIAGMSIVSRCAMMVLSLVIGFGQGFQPFCGFCYGAGLKQRVKNGFSFSVKVCFMFLLLISVIGWFFSSYIIALFSKEMAVIDIGKQALQWQLLVLPLLSFTIMSNMLLQTIRKPWRANLLASARSGLFFIPLILILPRLFGLAGVEMCQAFSDLLAFLIALPIVNTTFKEFGSMA